MLEQDTTIKVTRQTHADLARLGAKGETFDAIIRRLLAVYKARKPNG